MIPGSARGSRARQAIWIVLLSAGLTLSIAAQRGLDAQHTVPAPLDDALYLQSGATLKKASLGFDGLLADLYWIRTVQYFGGKLEAQRATSEVFDLRQMPQLEPLLRIVTELDPHHIAAYRFGAFFLQYLDPAKSVRFAEAGIRNNPAEWRLYQDAGFAYWRQRRFREAADAYLRGSRAPRAPVWMAAMAATMMARGGDRDTARELFRRLCEDNTDPFIKGVCEEQGKENEKSQAVEVRIIRVLKPSPDTGTRTAFAWINPAHVKRENINQLAKQMNQFFAKETAVRVFLWDDETDAELFGGAKADYFGGYDKHLRFIYGINRETCVEYLDFFPDKQAPGRREKNNFPCESTAKRERRQE